MLSKLCLLVCVLQPLKADNFVNIYENEFHVKIKHYVLCKKTITKTKERLDKYYEDSAPLISMVKKCFTEFRCGHTIISDAEHLRVSTRGRHAKNHQ